MVVPKGITVEDNEFYIDNIKDDDDFFHLTCHVEPNLVE